MPPRSRALPPSPRRIGACLDQGYHLFAYFRYLRSIGNWHAINVRLVQVVDDQHDTSSSNFLPISAVTSDV